MTLSRRTILAASGTGLALAAAGGVWRVARTPTTATDPWRLPAPPPADPRLDAFRHAILAPNPHNRQPWIIRLDGTDGATIFCDLDRRLPMTDPFDRQITIGFGCFLELARIAAAERGFQVDEDWFPEGEPQPRLDRRPIARLRFVPDATVERDPLFAAIPHRHSNKEPFDGRVPGPDRLRALEAVGAVGGETAWQMVLTEAQPDRVAALRALVVEAILLEMYLPRTHQESVDLMRIGVREVDANPDGIDLSGPSIEAMAGAGLISRATLADPASTAFRQGETMMAESYGSAPAFLTVSTSGNDRMSQLQAGRLYVRANLQATSAGLSMHPMSQALQEYPEMADLAGRMHALALPSQLPGVDAPMPPGGRVQMLARIGFGPDTPPSPRWPLETRLAQPL